MPQEGGTRQSPERTLSLCLDSTSASRQRFWWGQLPYPGNGTKQLTQELSPNQLLTTKCLPEHRGEMTSDRGWLWNGKPEWGPSAPFHFDKHLWNSWVPGSGLDSIPSVFRFPGLQTLPWVWHVPLRLLQCVSSIQRHLSVVYSGSQLIQRPS